MVSVEIVGYKRIDKDNKTLYYLSAESYTAKDTVGITTYNAFVSGEYLGKRGIKEEDLIGMFGSYYNVKSGKTFRSGISLNKEERKN